MRSLFLFAALATLLPRTQPADWNEISARAEKLIAEGSFELAHRAYEEASTLALEPEVKRWLLFRLADTDWRSAAATENPDTTRLERAKSALEVLQRAVERPEFRDDTWAEVEESLGDYEWLRRESQNLGAAMPHYRFALDHWAGAPNVERARSRWLAIAFRMGWPGRGDLLQNWWAGQIPLEIGADAMKVARTDRERAQAALLYAAIVRQRGGDFSEQQRGLEALDLAVSLGSETPWLDDALWMAAQWYENQGAPFVQEDGTWAQRPDYTKALAIYKRIVAEFPKGRSKWRDQAEAAVQRILSVDLSLGVGQAFLPGSEVAYQLSWRNVKSIELALYPVDLAHAVSFEDGGRRKRGDASSSEWLRTIDLARAEKLASWTHDTKDAGEHRPGGAQLRVEKKLAPGAYVLEARAGGAAARDVVLVSSTSLVLKCADDRALLWLTDARTSEPVAGADVALWERSYDGNRWTWKLSRLVTGEDGTVLAKLEPRRNQEELFVAATKGDRSAFVLGGNPWYRSTEVPWRIYAFTDRSTYRPGGRVEWKVIARTRKEGVYATPASAKLEYDIVDPKGATVGKGSLALNAFGSAWASFDTDATAALGEYRVNFHEGGSYVGNATLFRVEEYKLPEFEVTVSAARDAAGKPKLWRLGDKVEGTVEAATYFGAPVANADVEVIVKQRPMFRPWIPEHDYPWLYAGESSLRRNPYGGGEGQIVTRQTLRSDAEGRATFAFDTQKGAGQDLEFTVEARVTDASRREITGAGRVRVARLSYSVRAKPAHNVHRPGDTVEFRFEASDANESPVEAEGRVTVVRNRWVEVWIDPQGKEVRGARAPAITAGWKAKFRGYETEDVAASSLRTDAKGQASFSFPAGKEGYYTATWRSRDDRGGAIEGSAVAFVASGSTQELGYHAGGLDLVLDRDTFRAGEDAPVILCTPESGRWVLFSVESETLHSYRVVKVDGTAKLLTLAIGEEHVPNVFLSAITASDGDVLMDVKEVVVPPVRQFLTVDVTPDKGDVLPGGEGTLTVRTSGSDGEPVAAEIALALVDDSVAAIQGDYAGDPRAFFFGDRRRIWVRTQSSFEQRRFAKLVLGEEGVLKDERQAENELDGNGPKRYGARDEFGQLAMAKAQRSVLGDAAMPAASAAEAVGGMDFEAAKERKAENRADGPEEAAVQVRSDFRETALWKPDLVTDAKGEATIRVKYPESLTRWKATARVATTDARFGTGAATTRTQKPLIARLEAPRFFVVGDEATISGLFDNRTETSLHVKPALSVEGLDVLTETPAAIDVPAGGEVRVDWRVRVAIAGTAKLRLSARSGDLSDGMEKSFPMEPHGIDALVARALKMRGDELAFALDVPAARRKETTRMLVQVAPSLAVTMLDALPYLVDYPYGCTEQTLSRFLPAAIVAKTLRERGLSAEDAMTRVFGGIEPESAGATHPKGKRNLERLDRMIRQGLDRLYDFQHGDGGWAWWKEGDSDPFMTAYVVWGLSLARDAGVELRGGVIDRGAQYLSAEIVKAESEPDLAAWMIHALGASGVARGDDRTKVAFEKLWEGRGALNAYSRALLCLAAKSLGRDAQAKTLAENLVNGVTVDANPDGSRVDPKAGSAGHEGSMQTAHWGADRMWNRWSDGPVETTAFALRALLAVEPTTPYAEQAVNWLLQNRRGAQWSNTRDTAIAILALDDWLARSGEAARDVEYELTVNGKVVGRRKIGASEMLSAPAEFAIAAADVKDGKNEIRLRKISGEGPLYLAARASFFSLEEPVPARGSQIFVKRQYYKLVGRPTLLKGQVYERVALEDGGSVASGERVEVVLTLESKNDFEYLLFEDRKPAGFEAVELRSGGPCDARELKSGEVEHRFGANAPALVADPLDLARYTSRQRAAHEEFRDEKVAFFLDKLPQGVWEIRYDLRAEVPGRFHALPTLGEAMYVPEIRCNGAETRVTVLDRLPAGD